MFELSIEYTEKKPIEELYLCSAVKARLICKDVPESIKEKLKHKPIDALVEIKDYSSTRDSCRTQATIAYAIGSSVATYTKLLIGKTNIDKEFTDIYLKEYFAMKEAIAILKKNYTTRKIVITNKPVIMLPNDIVAGVSA